MPDITDLILDDHEQFRRHFAKLDDMRARSAPPDALQQVWSPLAELLELHAAAEEQTFYPRLLDRGGNAQEETRDAVSDHNEIRAAVARACSKEPGSDAWWSAVLNARESNSDHMAEEEREALPDFRQHADEITRQQLGAQWIEFTRSHPGGHGLDLDQTDVDRYLREHP